MPMYEQPLRDTEVLVRGSPCSHSPPMDIKYVSNPTDETSVGIGEAFGKFKGIFGQAISYVKDQTLMATSNATDDSAAAEAKKEEETEPLV